MSHHVSYNGECLCSKIKYTVPHKPTEIANCHCTICQKLHKKPFVSFAKYNVKEVIIANKESLNCVRSSDRASRYYCYECNTYLFMYYDNSENVWMNTDTFKFTTSPVNHYDIYTDTAVNKHVF